MPNRDPPSSATSTADLPVMPVVLPPPTATFARDAEAHYLDRPRYCPACGTAFAAGLVVEYWVADDRVFSCWCAGCSWAGDIVKTARTIGVEPGDE